MPVASGIYLHNALDGLLSEILPRMEASDTARMYGALGRVPARGVAHSDVLYRWLGVLGSTWLFTDPAMDSPGVVSARLAMRLGIQDMHTVWLREATVQRVVNELRAMAVRSVW
ncbi:MAG: hypothetical protein V4662_13625 [Verrucomicrobiota bacterium]